MSAARPSALPRMVRPRPNISSELRDHKEHASVHYSRVATLDRRCLALHDTGRLLRSVKPSSFARGSIVAEIVKCQADIEVSSGHDLIFPSPIHSSVHVKLEELFQCNAIPWMILLLRQLHLSCCYSSRVAKRPVS